MSKKAVIYGDIATIHTSAPAVSVVLYLVVLCSMLGGCGEDDRGEAIRPLLDPVTAQYLQAGTDALDAYQYEAALAYTDSAKHRRPNMPDVAFLRGRIYAEMANLERSDSLYRQVLALDPDYPGAWNNLGNNAFRQKSYSEAIKYYRNELAQESAPIPWRGIGRAYVELGKSDSARYALEQALEIDTTYAPAHFNLALIYEDEGDLSKALDHARQAWRLSPEDYDYRYLMGSLMVKTRAHVEEAVPHLQAVTEHWPWHHASHYNLGQAFLQMGRQAEGKALLEQAEKLRAREVKVQNFSGVAQSKTDDPMAYAALGSALRRSGRLHDALRAYRVSMLLDSTNLEVQNNVANLYLLQQDTLAAIQTYRHILQQDPTFVDIWVNLGIVYAISGKRDEARAAWEAALQHEPNHQAAQAYLARLRREGGG